MRPLPFLAALTLALTACQTATEPAPAAATPTAAEAASDTLPAQSSQHGRLNISTLAKGLNHPWSLAFLPDASLLITERSGQLRRLAQDGTLSAPIQGVPAALAEGQGGLLDVAPSPGFADDAWIYLSYAEADAAGLSGTAVARGQLRGDTLQDVEVIFRQQPKLDSGHHYGSRLVFDRAGQLFITLGDRGQRPMAQQLENHQGTLIRVNADGSVPVDNPFLSTEGALPEIWSYGHRNQQGAAINPWTGVLWTHEHGPRGGDEINIPAAGKNYGWPIITHGIDYSGLAISEAVGKEKAGMEQPQYFWAVSPGISGMAFYDHARFPAWQHSLFVGSMAQRVLIRLSLDGDEVIGEERLLESLKWRIRDVRVGPDGAVYVLTDEDDGRLLKIELQG